MPGPLHCRQTYFKFFQDVFVVCFSISSVTSYHNVKTKWYPELHHNCPDIPIILVGTKVDQRIEGASDKSKIITSLQVSINCNQDENCHATSNPFHGSNVQMIAVMIELIIKFIFQGMSLANEVKAAKYLECSALTQEGLKEIFDEAIRAVLLKRNLSREKKRKRHCTLL